MVGLSAGGCGGRCAPSDVNELWPSSKREERVAAAYGFVRAHVVAAPLRRRGRKVRGLGALDLKAAPHRGWRSVAVPSPTSSDRRLCPRGRGGFSAYPFFKARKAPACAGPNELRGKRGGAAPTWTDFVCIPRALSMACPSRRGWVARWLGANE